MSRASPRFHRINPSLPPVGSNNGVALYRIVGTIENQMTISTFMYSAANNAPTQAQLTNLLTSISNILLSNYLALISLDWAVVQEKLDVVHRNDIIGTFQTTHAGNSGTRPTGHMPTEVSGIILRRSAFKGQHGRGRVSIPAPSVSDVTASRYTNATLLTNLGTFATSMGVGATDGTNSWTPCIGQRSSTSPKLVVAFAPVVLVTTTTLLGTVRRRKIGRGK